MVYMGTSGLHGYKWSTGVQVVYMGTSGLHGYKWTTGVRVVYMGTSGLQGYKWSTWVQVVYMGTSGLLGYKWSYLRSEDTLEILPVIMSLLSDGQQQSIDLHEGM